MSAKKDAIANIGGFVAIRDDEEFFHRLQARGIVFEGFHTDGGLAGRDLEAIGRAPGGSGRRDYLRHRIEQVAYLGGVLVAAGASVLRLFGDHAVPRRGRHAYATSRRTSFRRRRLHASCTSPAACGASRSSRRRDRGSATGANRLHRGGWSRLAVPRRVRYASSSMQPTPPSRSSVKRIRPRSAHHARSAGPPSLHSPLRARLTAGHTSARVSAPPARPRAIALNQGPCGPPGGRRAAG